MTPSLTGGARTTSDYTRNRTVLTPTRTMLVGVLARGRLDRDRVGSELVTAGGVDGLLCRRRRRGRRRCRGRSGGGCCCARRGLVTAAAASCGQPTQRDKCDSAGNSRGTTSQPTCIHDVVLSVPRLAHRRGDSTATVYWPRSSLAQLTMHAHGRLCTQNGENHAGPRLLHRMSRPDEVVIVAAPLPLKWRWRKPGRFRPRRTAGPSWLR
jgi:hypothetical protein